jgi:hypothetical protein
MSSAVRGRPGFRTVVARFLLRGGPATAVQRQNVRYETMVTRCRIALPTTDPYLMRRAFSRAVRVSCLGSLARRSRFSSLEVLDGLPQRGVVGGEQREQRLEQEEYERPCVRVMSIRCVFGVRTRYLYTAAGPGAGPEIDPPTAGQAITVGRRWIAGLGRSVR